MAYDTKAQEFVYGFYVRGWSKERALPKIREVYAGFAGSTWEDWENRFDWRERRALADAKLRDFEDICRTASAVLIQDLEAVRAKLLREIDAADQPDTQTVYAFASVTKQISEIARHHMASRQSDRVAMQVLNSAIERLFVELRGIPALAVALEEHATVVGQAVSAVAEQFGQ